MNEVIKASRNSRKTESRCPCCGEKVSPGRLVYQLGPPIGCKCNVEEWGDPENIPDICDCFEPYSDTETLICKHCEHCRECH